uniref:Uncharacterized protein n=1 Tax=Rhizophora mucronata TaxID=61149 RepID=A0A2P2N1Y4_RHIMU
MVMSLTSVRLFEGMLKRTTHVSEMVNSLLGILKFSLS